MTHEPLPAPRNDEEHLKALLPSGLIRLALGDVEAVERAHNFAIAMPNWFAQRGDGKCFVCFTGALILAELGLDRLASTVKAPTYRQAGIQIMSVGKIYEFYGTELAEKLMSLDSFRSGNWRQGIFDTGFATDEATEEKLLDDLGKLRLPVYYADPEGFKRVMREAADILEGAGL